MTGDLTTPIQVATTTITVNGIDVETQLNEILGLVEDMSDITYDNTKSGD